MAKSDRLPKLLLVVAAWVLAGSAGHSLGLIGSNLRAGSNDQNKEFDNSITLFAGLKAGTDKVAEVKRVYDRQIGVREVGNNRGVYVEKYLHYVGLGKGEPWCAAFVCWVYGESGVANPKSGWSPALFPARQVIWTRTARPEMPGMAPGSGKERLTPLPRTADIFGIYFADKKRIAHVGFVDVWEEKWVTTVEGNTNEEGSREGDGVYRKRRLVQSLYQVARYVN